MKIKNRDETVDIIRIFSLLCVISVHFLLKNDYYFEIVLGKKMFVMTFYWAFFIISVPMFLILTGYLMNKKEFSLKYYKGIIRVIILYIIFSILYSLYLYYGLKKPMNLNIFLQNLLSYNGTKYAWYVEMYINLFIFIPFLNILFNNLKDEKEAKWFIFILAVVIGLPPIINSFGFKILPNWWPSLYPFFYYYLGAYLSKYKPNISLHLNLLLLIISLLINTFFNFYMSYKKKFVLSSWNKYDSLFIMITASLVFNLLLKIKFKKENKVRSKILKILADASFGAYLISCVYDNVFYGILNANIINTKDRFIYAPVMIIIVFICSIVTSIVVNIIYDFIKNKLIIEKKREV